MAINILVDMKMHYPSTIFTPGIQTDMPKQTG